MRPKCVKGITWEKLTLQNNLLSKNNVNEILKCNLDQRKYEMLKNGWKRIAKKLGNSGKKGDNIYSFISRPVKGSKRYQKILDCKKTNLCRALKLQQLKTYKKITGIENMTEIRAKSLFGAWNQHILGSDNRVFLFKFYNNILGTNLRVSKFNRDINRECTFCTLSKSFPAPREEFAHIFYFCPHSEKIIREFFSKYTTIKLPDCKTFFSSDYGEDENINIAMQIVIDILQFFIWSSKLEKKLPQQCLIFENLNNTIARIQKTSEKTSLLLNNCPLFRQLRNVEHP